MALITACGRWLVAALSKYTKCWFSVCWNNGNCTLKIIGSKAMAEKKLNVAREHLTDVMKERKTHEALRDKAFEEFMQEENKAEGKAVDELTSYTYGQKRQVKN